MENILVGDSRLVIGFEYNVEHIRRGKVIATEKVKNLVPTEGLNHILSTVFKAGTQLTSWYVGIFEGNYTPVLGLTAATVASASTESTAYTSATRVAWASGSVSAGTLDNSASKAEFIMNADKTIYGGFLISSNAKGGSAGVLGSAVRFATAKVLETDDTLRITAGLILANAP